MKYGLPSALALSAAASLTLLSGNTVVLNLFNNWFNTTHNHEPVKPPPSDLTNPPPQADKPSITINLPPITVSPQLNFNPNLIWDIPMTVSPQVNVTPNFEINPEINLFPSVEVNPDIKINSNLNWPVNVQIDAGADHSPQGSRVPTDPSFSGRSSPEANDANSFSESLAPTWGPPTLRPSTSQQGIFPAVEQAAEPAIASAIDESSSPFQFSPQELPVELKLMVGKGSTSSPQEIVQAKQFPASKGWVGAGSVDSIENHKDIPEPGMLLGMVLIGIKLMTFKLK